MTGRRVPHPFAFCAKGWESTNLMARKRHLPERLVPLHNPVAILQQIGPRRLITIDRVYTIVYFLFPAFSPHPYPHLP